MNKQFAADTKIAILWNMSLKLLQNSWIYESELPIFNWAEFCVFIYFLFFMACGCWHDVRGVNIYWTYQECHI